MSTILKIITNNRLIALFCALLMSSYTVAEFSVATVDSTWTADSIPEGEMCQRFGGKNPQSPELAISGIPKGTQAIVMYFSDRTFKGMDNGGHGIVGFKTADAGDAVTVPRVPGHVVELSAPLFVVAAHKAPTWDKAGGYLPPCSGGRGNKYVIDVKAVTLNEDNSVAEVLAESTVPLATY